MRVRDIMLSKVRIEAPVAYVLLLIGAFLLSFTLSYVFDNDPAYSPGHEGYRIERSGE